MDVSTPLEAVAGGSEVIDGEAEFKNSGRRVSADPGRGVKADSGVAVVITGLSVSDSLSTTSPSTPIRGSFDGPGVVKSVRELVV